MFQLIKNFYGDECAERTGVPKINHIIEGLQILDYIESDQDTRDAFCIHPMIQTDEELAGRYEDGLVEGISTNVLILAMEYRRVANDFLCRPETDNKELGRNLLTPFGHVYDMLLADKLQNYKDFLIHHYGTHERSDQLEAYFLKWLAHLGFWRMEDRIRILQSFGAENIIRVW